MAWPAKVDIPGYEGVYYATPEGLVFRYGKKEPLKVSCSGQRRHFVHLSYNGKVKSEYMSTIMRKCFFGNTDKKLVHVGERSDFSVWNLKPMEESDANKVAASNQGIAVVRIHNGEPQFYRSLKACEDENLICDKTLRKYLRNPKMKTVDGAKYVYESAYKPSMCEVM